MSRTTDPHHKLLANPGAKAKLAAATWVFLALIWTVVISLIGLAALVYVGFTWGGWALYGDGTTDPATFYPLVKFGIIACYAVTLGLGNVACIRQARRAFRV